MANKYNFLSQSIIPDNHQPVRCGPVQGRVTPQQALTYDGGTTAAWTPDDALRSPWPVYSPNNPSPELVLEVAGLKKEVATLRDDIKDLRSQFAGEVKSNE
jgi:hypothetical protein